MPPNCADEWNNFLERVNCLNEEELKRSDELEEQLRLWASYRGQTLTRTGMNKELLVIWVVPLWFPFHSFAFSIFLFLGSNRWVWVPE